jgi:ABC-2 type transport system permease protein
MLKRIFALIIKEFLAVLSDPKSRTVLIVPPIIQLVIFTFAATLDVQNVSIGILNRDNGEQGFELAQRFHGSPTFRYITYLNGVQEIQPFIDNQKGLMVVHMDEQFSRNLNAGKQADVQLIMDGRKSNATQIVQGYAVQIISQFNADFTSRNQIKQQRTQIFPYFWYNPNLLYYWYNVPSLCGILTMLEALIVTANSIARERELGTFDQILVSPLLPIEVLIGKAVPAIVIGMAEGLFIVFVGVFIFKIPFTGSLLTLCFSMFVFVCCIVGVGIFMSSLCSTQQQAILGTFIFTSPSVLLSGFATPIENMPTWLQPFTYLIPLRYFLIVVKGTFLKAMPFNVVLENTWPMAIIAIFTLSCSVWFFKRRLE